MILIVDGTLHGVGWANFTCPVSDPIAAFDLITSYAARGFRINHARLFERGIQIDLPADVFNPHSEHCPFESLRWEWEQVLRERPISPSKLHRQVYINWNRRLVRYYDRQINLVIEGILRLEYQIRQSTPPSTNGLEQVASERQKFLLQSRYARVQSLETLRQKTVRNLRDLEASR
ncbi:hypothetical protein ACFQ4C_17775 [Larkinella insperata]|uniref:Uncharacterized protein n=1 Tax=Larkinella insperata TaxID=332158 RepID=A0ABW3QD56_9BACT|nr:hypothetical protein [Larkinella insperata]